MTTEQKQARLQELDAIYQSLMSQPGKTQKEEKWFWIFDGEMATVGVFQN